MTWEWRDSGPQKPGLPGILKALRRLEWARRMSLVRSGLTWTINPLVARLIGADEDP